MITDYIEYLHNIGHQTNRIRHKGRRVTQLIVYDIEKSKHLIDSGKYEKIAYCTDKKGALRSDSWTDINILHSQAKERTGYPTQKPAELYERMIQASSNQDDIVLDPFCGSGTTLVSANNLSRYYIGIDKNPAGYQNM